MAAVTIIICIFSVFYCTLICYYCIGWWRLKEYRLSNQEHSTKVTVIIAVRNEEKNISSLLQDISDQYYAKNNIQIILVDDFSEDQTESIVKQLNIQNLLYLKLSDQQIFNTSSSRKKAGKKAAIETAMKYASGELIITTDADCHVRSEWISAFVDYYETHKPVMIAGMVNYYYDSSLLGKFQTLDFLSLVGIAAASAQNGFYNLCNGANLAYTKAAFDSVEGYKNIDHIESGDDMMLMHKMAKKFPGKITYLKNKDSMVYTSTESDFLSFWNQRVRWTSKSTHYEDKRITCILIFVYAFNLIVLLNLIIGIFYSQFLQLASILFLVKISIDTLFIYQVAKYFRRENLLWYFLPMQIAHIFYILLIAPAGVFGNYTWKNRTIKMKK